MDTSTVAKTAKRAAKSLNISNEADKTANRDFGPPDGNNYVPSSSLESQSPLLTNAI